MVQNQHRLIAIIIIAVSIMGHNPTIDVSLCFRIACLRYIIHAEISVLRERGILFLLRCCWSLRNRDCQAVNIRLFVKHGKSHGTIEAYRITIV